MNVFYIVMLAPCKSPTARNSPFYVFVLKFATRDTRETKRKLLLFNFKYIKNT